ncbi:MAG: DNA polymerase III subunit alpha, partial [Clostridiales bacterium]|nr:DNA polymerase III subunit alpha [Clostridiales bacterium]
MRPFVHLHLHTEYSLLDGAVRLDKLFSACAESGMPAVAVTDHGNMFAALKFFEAANKHNEKHPEHKVKPIFGCEFYVDKDLRVKETPDGRMPKFHHLVLLAKNYKGYENLVKLNSVAYVDGYYYKPRIDYALLKDHAEGLICLTACIAGGIPRLLAAGDSIGAKTLALDLKNAFAPGDFYIELQDHNIPAQREILSQLVMLAQEIDAPLVATNDVHYLRKEDAETQKVLMAIAFKRSFSDMGDDGGDDGYFPTEEFYLKSGDEMAEKFAFAAESIDNTLIIADKCNVEMRYKQPLLPGYAPPDGKSPYDYLRELTELGLAKKYRDARENGPRAAEIRARADYELGIIAKQGFLEYYLIVWDFIHKAEEMGIPVGPGRGSGVGSIVAYAIGITKVDPLKYNLLFERFLNSERVSMPDFDIDFCYERRGEVIEYVIEKYGAPRVAQIVTFGTLAARAAIKDVGRVYGVMYSETDRISKLIPFTPKPDPLRKYLDAIPDLRQAYDADPQNKKVLDMAMAIEGMPRQTSMHAAGVVICKDDIDKFVPLQRNGEDVTTQFDMIEVERVGLLKMDFLGLRTLTDVKKAVDYVYENRGVKIDFYDMEYDDPAVYELIGDGDTAAVFQVESAGMKRFMAQLQPTNLEDIIAGIALFRPGPMDSIPTYIANKKNPAGIAYKHEILRPILDVTYGCIVYQEQVMQIVREMGGYSLGRADIVRRLMSKKKASEMKKEREIFVHGLTGKDGKPEVEGAVARGIPESVALEVFGEMESFAQYAFNKSHAAA